LGKNALDDDLVTGSKCVLHDHTAALVLNRGTHKRFKEIVAQAGVNCTGDEGNRIWSTPGQ
jgi:hypothetical protein